MPSVEIEIGQKAPAFTLPNQDDEKVALKDLAGQWVVLYFYPKDDTPGCTTQACEFTESIADFQDLDATVIGVSPDKPESHRKFIAKHNLKLPLLSDPKHTMMEKYAAYREKNMYGVVALGVIRSTVIIDPVGRIAHHYKRAKAAGHAAAVHQRLQDLQAKYE